MNENLRKVFRKIDILNLIFVSVLIMSVCVCCQESVLSQNSCPVDKVKLGLVSSLDVVRNPSMYLGKIIVFQAKFDKFSTLGLDYKGALRDSKDYISFLIQRDDVSDHVVPLSEMKIFIKKKEAEKFVDLETGDKIEVTAKVFAKALDDPWLDTISIKVLESKKKLKSGDIKK